MKVVVFMLCPVGCAADITRSTEGGYHLMTYLHALSGSAVLMNVSANTGQRGTAASTTSSINGVKS